MKKVALFLLLSSFVSLTTFAQTHAKKGKYGFLKGEKMLNLEFDYDNMNVGKKLTEEEYVAKKVAEYNEDEAGRGEKWKASWFDSREERYEPKFEELINKYLLKAGLEAKKGADAKYTLIVKSVFTEPGFNVGVARKPAYVDYEMTFVETATKKVVATYALLKIPGSQMMGFDFDAGTRIAESYAKSGKMMGAYISKAL
ncbi:hypothetical protein [Arcticibacterium luteifluviistationis]|uniref:DUF4468 domain-containing protein n=1 Tax=Arcticibacterium luteifluviistationis TaxID=1784714 RepID=A0A2Z4GDI3_9BACT|nr:hypothetical protein [Arcticibacterium luteifluviistationis]AWV99177.1 hypothetical protein DJ013_13770 [Arcticibacterium luteifluviistationis]